MGETTDRQAVIDDLNVALPLQQRCALAFAVAAGTIPGPEGVALAPHLRSVAGDELRDLERIAARVASLGGVPAEDVAPLGIPTGWRAMIERLVAIEREALDAVVEAIPADADDAEGEATEHLLEHVIARKRDALELLERSLRQ